MCYLYRKRTKQKNSCNWKRYCPVLLLVELKWNTQGCAWGRFSPSHSSLRFVAIVLPRMQEKNTVFAGKMKVFCRLVPLSSVETPKRNLKEEIENLNVRSNWEILTMIKIGCVLLLEKSKSAFHIAKQNRYDVMNLLCSYSDGTVVYELL